jgi:chromosome segregation ATPase
MCTLNFLHGDELKEYPNLQWYGQEATNLTRVPGNLFDSNPKMKFVGFAVNQIQHVGEGLLDHLKDLQEVWFPFEVCIDKIAFSPSEIPALIEVLRQNCTDIQLRCQIEDLEDFVCGLDEEVGNLKRRVEALEGKNRNLSEKMRKSEKKFEVQINGLKREVESLKVDKIFLINQIEDLQIKNEATKYQTENLKSKNENFKNQLETLKKIVENLKADREILANQLEKLNAENQVILQQLELIENI